MATTEADAPIHARRTTELTLDFLAYLELERGLSRNTLEAYRTDLQQYGEFLQRRGIDPLAAGTVDLAAFVSELAAGGVQRPPVAPATLQRKIACLRSFYRICAASRSSATTRPWTFARRERARACRRSSAATRCSGC